MQTRNKLVLALCALGAALPALSATRALLPPQDGDMVPATLLPRTTVAPAAQAVAQPRVHVERQPVSVSWPLPRDAALQARPQPFARSSREYWTDVSATELQRGVELPLSAPGAVIRLSPGDGTGGRLQPSAVRLRLGSRTLGADQAASQLADAASLRAAGMAVPDATLVMKLRPELGSGTATLQAPTASGRYVVHVFEPQSAFSVTARADRDDLLVGQRLHLRVGMQEGERDRPLQAAGGFLRAPDGSTTLLDYRRQPDGSFAAEIAPAAVPATPGLWEVHSFTVGDDGQGHAVRRDTTTVFTAATPDARLDGAAEVRRAADRGLDVRLGVAAASASRYAASAVLYGRDAHGRMVPAAYAQSAAWLEPGNAALVLHYDAASLRGVGAPYELRDLRLQDQPAMGLVERRALALRFDAP
ncbi:DUF4785 domain-containing protein [Fulvimonas soli]|jgi:hypothetical protein|uniref:Uncharacterized protein DUF4785 n=1 Tax=Fulvimonas soli TaxID=155197 RepID=A0A316I9R6_9GAMM|nr:DUF4785 domain-containing protein [Fulvimonas soli]PWK89795.1 uncharacterized protein DUF4785 [Fulvimonas soli]TNY27564.1 DUF4785 domain-containing protein [Fulvimonas soli]